MSSTSSAPSVAVVGAGIVGLCTAWHLARRGARVTLFDPNSPGSGCSSGNAGAISAGSVVPLAMPGLLRDLPAMLLDRAAPLHIPVRYWATALPWLLRFVRSADPRRVAHIAEALASLYHPAVERHVEILTELGATDLVRRSGQLYLYRNEAGLRKDRSSWDLRRRHGVRVEDIDRKAIEALEPAVGPAYQRGVFLPDQGMSANPLRQARVIAEGLQRLGVTFIRQAVRGLVLEGQMVRGVETGERTYQADHVVLAAGAWSAVLLRALGIRVPLESQRGYHVDLPASGITLSRPVVPADRKVFITPMETGLRVAGTVEFGGLDAPPSEARARLLLDDLAEAFPQARSVGHDAFWMGHRPCLPDSLPVLGPSAAWQGLWFGFGHGHLGLTGSAVSGDVLARRLMGERPNIDLAPFAIERFAA